MQHYERLIIQNYGFDHFLTIQKLYQLGLLRNQVWIHSNLINFIDLNLANYYSFFIFRQLGAAVADILYSNVPFNSLEMMFQKQSRMTSPMFIACNFWKVWDSVSFVMLNSPLQLCPFEHPTNSTQTETISVGDIKRLSSVIVAEASGGWRVRSACDI